MVSAQQPVQSLAQAEAAENLKSIQKILELPEDQIDLARVKLTIDQMLDPGIDVEHSLVQVDAMVETLREQLPSNPTRRDKLEALRKYLYQAGPWNQYRPFSYDLTDPLGRNLRNKLLPTYLTTRKGNCVSMPLLFIILGQKIGLDVTAATAPEHVFVKYRDEAGNLYNLEATSGAGFARDIWIRQQMPMTDQAIANGIYMRPLTKGETAVLIVNTLNESYALRRQEADRIDLATLQLKHDPTSIVAVLNLASAYSRTLNSYRSSVAYTTLLQPTREREIYFQLQQKLDYWHAQAVALGWRDPTEALEPVDPSVDEPKSPKSTPKPRRNAQSKVTQTP